MTAGKVAEQLMALQKAVTLGEVVDFRLWPVTTYCSADDLGVEADINNGSVVIDPFGLMPVDPQKEIT